MSLARKIATMFGAGGVIAAENLPVVADGVKPGTIMPFAGDVAPPGCLLCYGQVISRVTYAALFAVIGTTYGAVRRQHHLRTA